MNDLIARRQNKFVHIHDQLLNILFIDLGLIRLTSQDTSVLKTFNVLPGNTYVHVFKLFTGHFFSPTNSLGDCIHCLFDIRNHSSKHPFTFYFSEAKYFKFSVIIFITCYGTNFSGSYINSYDQFFLFLFFHNCNGLMVFAIIKPLPPRDPG